VYREIERVEEQLKQVFEGEAWHGPSVLELLQDVTPESAYAHPVTGAHSIWELVLHLLSGYGLVLRRIRGNDAPLSPEEEWPPVPTPTVSTWKETLQALRQANRELRQAVRGFNPERFDSPLVSQPRYTAYTQFIGTTQHDAYHAGQIALLKKTLQATSNRAVRA
jgi:uncharacterized damage-inducible protein DinB